MSTAGFEGIEGIALSGPPAHPQVRIKKPTPFTRPAVQVSAAPVRRQWRQVSARDLVVGDTVPGLGTLWQIRVLAGQVHLDGGEDARATYRPTEPIFAFTAAASTAQ